MTKVKNGITVYNIEGNGCLNGVYINEHANGTVVNEILRKDTQDISKIDGTYTFHYFDENNDSYVGTAIISESHNVYDISWQVNTDSKPRFYGKGYRIGEKQLIFSYWSA